MVSTAGVSPFAVLAGPTASGKTELALRMARARQGAIEIVNADSMQVYRGMDIGTAKPSREELDEIPHHLIDIRDPDEPFTAAEFVREARAAIAGIESRGHRALVVGGTGFYLRALLYGVWDGPPADPAVRARLSGLASVDLHSRLAGLDPESAARIGPADRYRLTRALEIIGLAGRTPTELQARVSASADPRIELWVVDREPAELERRLCLRCERMLAQGLVEEVRRIREAAPGARALGAVGYKEVIAYLDGKPPAGRKIAPGLEGLRREIELSTRQLVKKQRTWFRNLQAKAGKQARLFTLPSESWIQDFERLYPQI